MSVPAAHRWSRGAGVLVAVIDSGVDATHQDLAGSGQDERDFVETGPGARDGGRHGTGIAGVIAAVDNNGVGIVGVAPDVGLLALRACWPARTADTAVCNTFTLAQALVAAIDARADVINLSLVGPADPLLSALTNRATLAGAIVVGAVPVGGRMDGFPAGAPGVLPVEMAEDAAAASTALLAPGKEILTLVPGGRYDFATGNSLAVGNASGIVALLRARRHVTAAEARTLLAGSMHSVGQAERGTRSIDACAALTALLASGDCPAKEPGTRDSAALHATRDRAGLP
jgi:subtilisin family serine protease